MNVRDDMLIALVKEVLGPRDGPMEVLPEIQDPRSEYVTGVLEPRYVHSEEERPEDNVDEVIEETSSDEDQDNQGYVAATGVFAPALDPRALPRSIGISFTVEAGQEDPSIEICATWARYNKSQDGWHRESDYYLTGPIKTREDKQSFAPVPGVRIQLRSRPINGNAFRITVFLVNEQEIPAEERPSSVHYLFQPQIRVRLIPGTRLVPVQAGGDSELNGMLAEELREEQSLSMQYRDRTALARGHMCAAVWRNIDPERPYEGMDHPTEAPYAWTDAGVVPEPAREKFLLADVRTEMIPLYLVQAPEMDWNPCYGPEPVLDPAILAETWKPDAVRQALQPLIEGYQAWIAEQEARIPALEEKFHAVAAANLEQCRRVAERMAEAVAILCKDQEARLAFCFANKAIALQAYWKNKDRPLIWRPFQLAFILINIPPLADPFHKDRDTCDLLWFPTGGGKTEAYLGLTAFLLGLRRLRGKNDPDDGLWGAGVAVISRYTLRLLTIQQFRRALGVITACELLRVQGLKEGRAVGWRPKEYPYSDTTFLWGGIRFSAGLWVGGNVTPNQLRGFGIWLSDRPAQYIPGALDILGGLKRSYDGPDEELRKKAGYNPDINGEPAQVMQCPVCGSHLAISEEGLSEGTHTLYVLCHGLPAAAPSLTILPPPPAGIHISDCRIVNSRRNYSTLALTVEINSQKRWDADSIDHYFWKRLLPCLGSGVELQCARPARPGYFVLSYPNQQHNRTDADFEIFCPNPDCDLNQHHWVEAAPLPREKTGGEKQNALQKALFSPTFTPGLPVTMNWQNAPEFFQDGDNSNRSVSIPVPAYTVDDQVYARCPSLIIATVDKFARLAFEGEAATMFGNVTHYHSRHGYYRCGCPAEHPSQKNRSASDGYFRHPSNEKLSCEVKPFAPPDLILQDELHLIEGPLGSMVGIYETAVDFLCQRKVKDRVIRPKYIASTATVRRAESQVQSLFDRRLAQFPPPAISADERFFAVTGEAHPLDSSKAGRLYVGICAPGKGAQTPIVRIWSSLLQRSSALKGQVPDAELDPFWTLVGYFNALRELAGAVSLYRQDIPEWLKHRDPNPRILDYFRQVELSSRAKSTELPALLKKIETQFPSPGAQDAVFSTSMFGTGVDVDRLSLMVVHGQPKTTSSYIQATGRVGRRTSGLVITFFRATRPRDLDHYEFFTGYHQALYRYVEPITVAPFSPRARERCLGPLAVIILRQASEINGVKLNEKWRIQQRFDGQFYAGALIMSGSRYNPEVERIPRLLEERAQQQPEGRVPPIDITQQECASELDRWRLIALRHQNPNEFVYYEPAVVREPQRHVVLGDSQHHQRFEEAFENAPQSLRDVEETTTFKD